MKKRVHSSYDSSKNLDKFSDKPNVSFNSNCNNLSIENNGVVSLESSRSKSPGGKFFVN